MPYGVLNLTNTDTIFRPLANVREVSVVFRDGFSVESEFQLNPSDAVWDADSEYRNHFKFQGDLQGQISD